MNFYNIIFYKCVFVHITNNYTKGHSFERVLIGGAGKDKGKVKNDENFILVQNFQQSKLKN